MIDIFALSLIHGLILVVLLRLVRNPELDRDPAIEDRRSRRAARRTPRFED